MIVGSSDHQFLNHSAGIWPNTTSTNISLVLNATDEAAQERCYSSIVRWLGAQRSYNLTDKVETHSMTTTMVIEGFRGRECDGLRRDLYTQENDLEGSWTDDRTAHHWTWSGMLTISSSLKGISEYADSVTRPSCFIGQAVCIQEYWKAAGNPDIERVNFLDDDWWNTEPPCPAWTYAYGEEDPYQYDLASRSCAIGLDNDYAGADVWVWPEDNVSLDICADDYYGTQRTLSSNRTFHTKPRVMTVSDVVFTARSLDYGDPMAQMYAKSTWTGNYTFTSPTIYLAYENMLAFASSTKIVQTQRGFLPVHPSHLSSIVWKCADSQSRSFRDIVEANLNRVPPGNIPQCDLVPETRRFNPADVYSTLPAAAWYAANLRYCGGGINFTYYDFLHRCQSISPNAYKPLLYVQAEAFWSFNQNMSSRACSAPPFINDPPQRIRPTGRQRYNSYGTSIHFRGRERRIESRIAEWEGFGKTVTHVAYAGADKFKIDSGDGQS